MNLILDYEDSSAAVAMERLVAKHGVLSVSAALLALMLRPKTRRLPDGLSEHMRRDIGLVPKFSRRDFRDIR